MPFKQLSDFSRQSSVRKKLSAFGYQLSAHKTVQAISWYLAPAHTQQGIAQLAVILLLVAGLAVGVYVVQHQTNLIPHASEGDGVQPGYCESDYVFNGGDAGDDNNWSYVGDCGEYYRDHSDDNSYICGLAGGSWEDDRCNTGQSDAPQNNDSDNSPEQCTYNETCESDGQQGVRSCTGTMQDNVCKYDPGVSPKCSSCDVGNGSLKENSDSSKEACQQAGGTWSNDHCNTGSGQTPSQGGESAPGDQSSGGSSQQYDQGDCRDGAQVYKDGYTWISYCNKVCSKNSDCPQNTSDGAVNPETSNWCYGFNNGQAPRCMMLVQTDNKQVTDQNRKSTNEQAVQNIKSTLSSGGNPNGGSNTGSTNNSGTDAANQQANEDKKAQVQAQIKQRSDLVTELTTLQNTANLNNSALTQEIARAQQLLTTASSDATSCYSISQTPATDQCDANAQAANDAATAASRVALFDAVAAGVPNTCVKVDMAVGKDTQNSQIEVTPAGGSGLSRLFMCRGAESKAGAHDGEIKWRVRDDNGGLQEVSQNSLNQLGLSTGQTSINTIPQDYINRRNNAATLASQPAYSASTSVSTGNNSWAEVPVSSCKLNCPSFPSGALCYKYGTFDQFNCSGQTLSALNSTCRGGVCP